MCETQILGHLYPALRGTPLRREFTRPSNSKAYGDARDRLLEADDMEARKAEIRIQGIDETNGDNLTKLDDGAMKLIVAADFVLDKYRGAATRLTDVDVKELHEALLAYHFAANTLRRLQQFELSADFYLISARIGDAVLKSLSPREYCESDVAAEHLGWANRSLLRSRAAYREQGSNDRAEGVYVFTQDLRRSVALHTPNLRVWFVLRVWSTLSRYGTNLRRLVAMYAVWVFLMSSLLLALGGTFDAPAAVEAFQATLTVSFGGSALASSTPLPEVIEWFHLFLKIAGFVWAALLGQLIVHRTAASL